MDNLMSDASIIAAIAALIAAAAFMIRMGAQALNSVVMTRNEVSKTRAENERLKAEAEARDQDAENEQQAKIITIMDRMVEYQRESDQHNRETANRFATIAEDFGTASNRHIETDERVAAGLREMAAENKALRISMEAWPKTVDGTIEDLTKKVEAVEAAIQVGNQDHSSIKAILRHEVVPGLEKIIQLLNTPTPTPPGQSAEPPSKTTPLNADGAEHAAMVDFTPDELPRTGTDG